MCNPTCTDVYLKFKVSLKSDFKKCDYHKDLILKAFKQ